MGKIEIIGEKRVFNQYLKIDEGEILHHLDNGETVTYSRFKLERPDAVVVLLYNRTQDTVVLVKQFRYPTASKRKNPYIIEAIAGKIDDGEKPRLAALREVLEETGYVIKESELIPLTKGFASPGYSSEIIYNYAAVVTNKHKKHKGGGKEEENEDIEIIEMPYLEFRAFCENGSLIDSKTRLVYFDASHAGIFNQKREIPNVPKKDRVQMSEGVDTNENKQLKLFEDEQN